MISAPELLENLDWRYVDDQYLDISQDANFYGYVATQLTHLPRLLGYDPCKLLSYIPLYGSKSLTKELITSHRIYKSFFHETQNRTFIENHIP